MLSFLSNYLEHNYLVELVNLQSIHIDFFSYLLFHVLLLLILMVSVPYPFLLNFILFVGFGFLL